MTSRLTKFCYSIVTPRPSPNSFTSPSISKGMMSALAAEIPLRRPNRARTTSDDRINITRIVLTGGPCAGKTTAIASIA